MTSSSKSDGTESKTVKNKGSPGVSTSHVRVGKPTEREGKGLNKLLQSDAMLEHTAGNQGFTGFTAESNNLTSQH